MYYLMSVLVGAIRNNMMAFFFLILTGFLFNINIPSSFIGIILLLGLFAMVLAGYLYFFKPHPCPYYELCEEGNCKILMAVRDFDYFVIPQNRTPKKVPISRISSLPEGESAQFKQEIRMAVSRQRELFFYVGRGEWVKIDS